MSDIVCCKDCIYSDQTNLAGNYAEPFNFVYCTYYKHIISIVRGCDNGKQKPKTNADRIRAMSDAELAREFTSLDMFCCPVSGVNCAKEPKCQDCFKRWLKQEAGT